MRRNHLFGLALAMALVVLAVSAAGGNANARAKDYVVLYTEGASLSSARLAVQAIGGQILSENTSVGVATVRTANGSFLADVTKQAALRGAARNVPVGYEAPQARGNKDSIERLTTAQKAAAGKHGKKSKKGGKKGPDDEPLADLQWDMAMIHATSDGSYKKQMGDPGVRVGIIDTGVDGKHPDIAPNFDAALSRNFVTDMHDIDGSPFGDPGPCEVEPSCVDPVDADDNGHGTHVAGTIGAALNGIGIAGIAPKVTLVNLRAGQDSGFFFLQPSLDALTYAADNGIDVVNMSYYIDPWLYNCAANPADSDEQQLEQRTIVEATNRALDYAYKHGVTLIAASGNESQDLDNVTFDDSSPDYPFGTSYPRNVDDACPSMPSQGKHVIGVGSVGPDTNKAYYSNWGSKDTKVTAPGGDYFDGDPDLAWEDGALSAYSAEAALQWGDITGLPCGEPTWDAVVKVVYDGGKCAYYAYFQGTSMAAPHAVGVAALIISEYGKKDRGKKGGQLEMKPKEVEKILTQTATDHPCPNPPVLDYSYLSFLDASANATCVGNKDFNNIWGDGIVDALAAVSGKK